MRHELSVTIHEISTSWKNVRWRALYKYWAWHQSLPKTNALVNVYRVSHWETLRFYCNLGEIREVKFLMQHIYYIKLFIGFKDTIPISNSPKKLKLMFSLLFCLPLNSINRMDYSINKTMSRATSRQRFSDLLNAKFPEGIFMFWHCQFIVKLEKWLLCEQISIYSQNYC